MKLTAAAVAVALTVAACGGSTEQAATPTVQQAPPIPTHEHWWKNVATSDWQDAICSLAPNETIVSEPGDIWMSLTQSQRDDVIEYAQPVCEARAETAAAEAEAEKQAKREERKAKREAEKREAQRERQQKIEAVGLDSSLTANQKVAVYDAVCEYLTQPGESDIFVLSETAESALPSGSTPQQQWDASVAAGWLMGTGACS